MVTGPQESRERHSGDIPNTLLLKTLEGCVQFRLFTSSVKGSLVGLVGHIWRPLQYIYFFFQSNYHRLELLELW